MTPKSKVDAVIREFIDNCKYVPVDAVKSIIGQLGAIADHALADEQITQSQEDIELYMQAMAEKTAELRDSITFHDRMHLLGEEAAEFINAHVDENNSFDLLAEYKTDIRNANLTNMPKIMVIINGHIVQVTVIGIFYRANEVVADYSTYAKGQRYLAGDCGRIAINALDPQSLCNIATEIQGILEHRKEQIAVGVSHIASGMDADNKPEDLKPTNVRYAPNEVGYNIPVLTNATLLWIAKRIDELKFIKDEVMAGKLGSVNMLTLNTELNALERIIRMEEGKSNA